jgi:rubrerythrin
MPYSIAVKLNKHEKHKTMATKELLFLLNGATLSAKIPGKNRLRYFELPQGGSMSSVFYSARDIVEAAVEKERKRRSFYATVTELSTNPDMKALFHYLTEEEDRHVAVFIQIRDSMPARTGPEEFREHMDAYLNSIIDDRLYSKMDSREFVQQAVDTWNVFALAIGFEKDAILFFMEFLPHLSEPDRKIVGELIVEEKGHIRKLAEVMREIGE